MYYNVLSGPPIPRGPVAVIGPRGFGGYGGNSASWGSWGEDVIDPAIVVDPGSVVDESVIVDDTTALDAVQVPFTTTSLVSPLVTATAEPYTPEVYDPSLHWSNLTGGVAGGGGGMIQAQVGQRQKMKAMQEKMKAQMAKMKAAQAGAGRGIPTWLLIGGAIAGAWFLFGRKRTASAA